MPTGFYHSRGRVARATCNARPRRSQVNEGIPLQNLPSLPTGTELNSEASRKKSLNERILDDISNETYECAICTDLIVPPSNTNHNMWQCQDCRQIFHYNCIQQWYQAKDLLPLNPSRQYFPDEGDTSWKCPLCKCSQTGTPEVRCWQGDINTSGNTCPATCGKQMQCAYQNYHVCERLCHPGECNIPCTAECMRTVRLVQHMASRERLPNDHPVSIMWQLILCLMIMFMMFFSGYLLMDLFSQRVAQPFIYKNFSKTARELASLFSLLGIIFIFYPALVFLLFHFVNMARKLGGTSRSRRGVFGLLAFILASGAVVTPLLWWFIAPDLAWYSQVHNSCDGYDTRFQMDNWNKGKFFGLKPPVPAKTRNPFPATQFMFKNKSRKYPNEASFFLSEHERTASLNDPSAFQRFYRFSGSLSDSPSLAVDVDLSNYVWRLIHLDTTDNANEWFATAAANTKRKFLPIRPIQYKSSPESTSDTEATWTPSPPTTQPPEKAPKNFPPIPSPLHTLTETLIRNGTFTNATKESPHMHLPELSLVIADMEIFQRRCENEPFLRVLKTNGKGEEEMRELVKDREWSREWDEDVVMRTVVEGYGRRWWKGLEMCVREGKRVLEKRGDEGEGVVEKLMVPLAVLGATRREMYVRKQRGFGCYD